ncbi:MAG TPA: O-antigen ligase family protein [Candidatus Woesebacteria bacterium]|nr:O-antigen ligase family protein [Candidatus Woesebacteria bacterium]HNS94550.1 O-antigen ligase family protein [Candidatus Woesebacteria bacterium]
MHTFFLTCVALCIGIGQLGRFTLPSGISFYVLESVIVAHSIYILWANRESVRTWKAGTLSRIALLWFGYVALLWVLTYSSYTHRENITALLYIVRVAALATYGYLLARAHINFRQLEKSLDILTLAVALVCLVQYFILPDLRFLLAYGWDPHMYRAVGTILDPPLVGSILGISLLYQWKKGNVWGIGLITLAIALLFSRSTYIAVMVTMAFYGLANRKWVGLTQWVFAFALVVYLAPYTIPARVDLESAKITRTSTVMSRSVELKEGIHAWMSSPVFGIGYNRVGAYKADHPTYERTEVSNHARSAFHSFWLTQLATTGIVGFSLMGAWIYRFLKVNLAMGYVFAVPAIIGLFDNVLFHPLVAVMAIVIAALIKHKQFFTQS